MRRFAKHGVLDEESVQRIRRGEVPCKTDGSVAEAACASEQGSAGFSLTSARGRVEFHCVLKPLERVLSPVAEVQAGARDKVLHGSRYKDFTCRGRCGNARSNVDGDPLHVPVVGLDLAGVQAASDVNAQRMDSLGDRTSTTDCPSGSVESGKKPVAQRLDLAATVARQFASDRCMMRIEQIMPALVADLLGSRGRADDVREQHRCQHAMAFALRNRSGEELLDTVADLLREEKKMILSGQLDQSRIGNVLCNKTPALDGDERVVLAVNDKGGHADG